MSLEQPLNQQPHWLAAEKLFDGTAWHGPTVLEIAGGRIRARHAPDALPAGITPEPLPGPVAPGFVDLQVNGGGGALFGADLDPESWRHIAAAHGRHGTTALMATVITGPPDRLERALALATAIEGAADAPGLAGLHLEGPWLSPARPGIHDPAHIRPMSDSEEAALIAAAAHVKLAVTLAPEAVPPAQIARLAAAGIRVLCGHSEADSEILAVAVEAGLCGMTHLFNAMAPLTARAPGPIGTGLSEAGLVCGLIADGRHVAPANLVLAWRAKGPAGLALVSDSMPAAAGGGAGFALAGIEIRCDGSRGPGCRGPDGTLAGTDLTLDRALAVMVKKAGVPLGDALTMATATPARLMGLADRGHLAPGARADFLCLDEALEVQAVWQGGTRLAAPALTSRDRPPPG